MLRILFNVDNHSEGEDKGMHAERMQTSQSGACSEWRQRAIRKPTGFHAGNDVVEVYVRLPYTGRVEKAGKVLAAFQKTKVLQPSESQRLIITFPLYAIMSYSTADAAYLLEAGEYEVHISRDAHTVVIPLAYHQEKDIILHNDPVTGAPFQNRFAAYEGDFHRLCRQDGADAKPNAPTESEHIAPESIVEYPHLQKRPPVRGGDKLIFGANNGIQLPNMKGKAWLAPMANEGYVKSLRHAYAADQAGFGQALRESVKGICWMVLHTNAMSPIEIEEDNLEA